MLMFTYGDIVLVKTDAPAEMRPGQTASVVGINTEHEMSRSPFDQFLPGTVYLVEFADGEALDIHEGMLEPLEA